MIDPPVRADKRCIQCGGPRRLEKLKPLYLRAMLTDPFCSSSCARAYWGTSLPSTRPVSAVESRA